MASADKELEEQLLEAGNRLVDPPSSVDELLPLLDHRFSAHHLLDCTRYLAFVRSGHRIAQPHTLSYLEQIESFLSRVEQSPAKSMQNALSVSLKALIADKLLRHSDDDVKVAVASCITEITRITAPDAPYDDDQMKEVFQLIVSSLENLYDKSSRSYAKRISILVTVAKVRSCVVMLDLECDALILEMFQHFFKAVREHHPENVVSSMETIMTLVVEESEDIPLELLSPILASVKKDNEEVFPNARNLGERVLESCATKLKPYLVQAVKNLHISLDDYSQVLASICQETSGSLEQNDICASSENVVDESKSAKATLDESMMAIKGDAKEVPPPQPVTPVGGSSPKSIMSNGITQAGEDETLVDPKSLKKQEDVNHSDPSKGMNKLGDEDPNSVNAKKVDCTEQKPELVTKRKGKQSSSSTQSAEPSEGSAVAHDKEAEKMLDSRGHAQDIPSSSHEDHSVEVAGPSENDKESDAKISSKKAGNDESGVVASPSPSESHPDENRSKKPGRAKKRERPTKEMTISSKDVSEKVPEGTSDSEARPTKRSARKAPGGSSHGKKITMVHSIDKTSGSTSDPDEKRQSTKKVDEGNKGGESSPRQLEHKKKRKRGKVSDLVVSEAAKDEEKEMVSSPKSGTRLTKDEQHPEETPKTTSKTKHSPGKENESHIKEYGENLVGSRVMYDDGDEEILNMKKEKWEFIEVDSASDEEEGRDHSSPDTSADVVLNKKGKSRADESTKQRKTDAFSKSGGGAESGKSKGASTKSDHKSKDSSKTDSKSKDSKSVGKSEDGGGKSRDHASKTGSTKFVNAAPKMTKSKNIDTPKSSKSKNDDSEPTFSAKSKETPKKSKKETLNTPSSKGKPPESGEKSNVNGSDKVKSGSSKTKIAENDYSRDSAKQVEDTKGMTSTSSKVKGSAAKSGKKRRRG
ncbi:Sister chromatid cohesion protein PDS5 like B-B [Senna tora]|uniref:Sister chromatid cohesion protein PDS5 like B-B n=1 Tax=Senna tora TaxID=362788 RepID=A0A834WCC2_9FABA|nr:Sister chromatid cohesion protein PDS5 like B-B [Senna tora]